MQQIIGHEERLLFFHYLRPPYSLKDNHKNPFPIGEHIFFIHINK